MKQCLWWKKVKGHLFEEVHGNRVVRIPYPMHFFFLFFFLHFFSQKFPGGGHLYACMWCHHQAGLQISPPKHWPGEVKIAILIKDKLVKWGPFSLTSCIWAPLSLTSCIWPIWTPFSLTYIKKGPLSTDLQKKKEVYFHRLISRPLPQVYVKSSKSSLYSCRICLRRCWGMMLNSGSRSGTGVIFFFFFFFFCTWLE